MNHLETMKAVCYVGLQWEDTDKKSENSSDKWPRLGCFRSLLI